MRIAQHISSRPVLGGASEVLQDEKLKGGCKRCKIFTTNLLLFLDLIVLHRATWYCMHTTAVHYILPNTECANAYVQISSSKPVKTKPKAKQKAAPSKTLFGDDDD